MQIAELRFLFLILNSAILILHSKQSCLSQGLEYFGIFDGQLF